MDDDLEAGKADDRFYVKSLTLENFRCFERLELRDLDPQFNLLVGTNGSGKSSVLLALAQILRKFAAHELDNGNTPIIRGTDIRIGEIIGEDQILHRRYIVPSSLGTTIEYNNEIWKDGERLDIVTDYGTISAPFNIPIIEKQKKLPESAFRTAPLIVFYTVRRNAYAEKLSDGWQEALEISRVGAFTHWSDAKTNSATLQNWCKDQTLFALQAESKNFSANLGIAAVRAARQLNLLNEAIKIAVPSAGEIYYDSGDKDIVVSLEDGTRQRLSHTSDGWQALVGLVADLVRRSCHLNAEFLGAETLRKTSGVVLIDEIDLHLHPKWQRQIVGALKNIFPKIQFFATTHSPQVIGECLPNEIVLLTKDGKQERPSRSFGMDSSWILECIMRAEGRDPGTAAKISEMFRALDQGRFDDAKRSVEEMRETIGEDRDVVAADAYLWNLGHEGEEAAE